MFLVEVDKYGSTKLSVKGMRQTWKIALTMAGERKIAHTVKILGSNVQQQLYPSGYEVLIVQEALVAWKCITMDNGELFAITIGIKMMPMLLVVNLGICLLLEFLMVTKFLMELDRYGWTISVVLERNKA